MLLHGPSLPKCFFYVMFPAIVAFIFRKGLIRSYAFYLVLLAIALVLMTVIRNFYDMQWLFYINPFIRILDFIMGIFFIFLLQHCQVFKQNEFFARYAASDYITHHTCFVFYGYSGSLQNIFQLSLLLYSYGFADIFFRFQQGALAKVMSARFLVFLGEASYSFYLTQDITARYMNWNGNRLEIIKTYFENNYIAFAAMQFMIALTVAIVVHLYVENL